MFMKKIALLITCTLVLASCSMTYPVAVKNNKSASKSGVAQRTIVLGICIGHTDLSLATAAKNGGITKIATVDYYVKNYVVAKTYKTIVTGE
jgi:PBP1b-binding outer membrane lipoprotein LpoB